MVYVSHICPSPYSTDSKQFRAGVRTKQDTFPIALPKCLCATFPPPENLLKHPHIANHKPRPQLAQRFCSPVGRQRVILASGCPSQTHRKYPQLPRPRGYSFSPQYDASRSIPQNSAGSSLTTTCLRRIPKIQSPPESRNTPQLHTATALTVDLRVARRWRMVWKRLGRCEKQAEVASAKRCTGVPIRMETSVPVIGNHPAPPPLALRGDLILVLYKLGCPSSTLNPGKQPTTHCNRTDPMMPSRYT